MEKEFVNYNQALKLKELGFDEPCFGYYDNEGELILNSHTNNYMQRFRYSAPTFQQAFRWFREKYNLKSWIEEYTKNKYIYEIRPHKIIDYKEGEIYVYATYEEAELTCLDKLIEIVEK